MIQRFALACALLAAPSAAQSLIYDNGPIVNFNGLAVLQTSTTATPPAPATGFHSVFGYGVNNGALIALADDFSIAGGALIQEVELYYYQTGASLTPTATGVFLEILDNAPNAGGLPVAGSPTFTNNLFNTNLVSHTFTGIFKVQDTNQALTNRPIMSVRVSLPTPVALGAGIYWLRLSMTGSLASGPWYPPISTLNQDVTGNAQQIVGAAGAWAPIVSGTAPNTYAQGLPFKIYGAGGTPGAIVQTATGCGTTGIQVEGAPNVGGYIRTTMTGVVGTPILGFSFNNTQTVFCGCTFSHAWDIQAFGASTSVLSIPNSIGFTGLPIGVQGIDFGATGGCPIGFTLTNGFVVTINN